MRESFFIFNNPGEKIGYITSQFIQGARLAGCSVSTNVETFDSDGRFCPGNLGNYGITFQPKPKVSDIIIIDETRFLSGEADVGQTSLNYYSNLQKNFRTALIYSNDDVNQITFPTNIAIFLPHQIKGFTKNPCAFPVPWGFTVEGFELAEAKIKSRERINNIIINFNPTHRQTVRESLMAAIETSVLKGLTFDKRQLFDSCYAEQLSEAKFILAVGGAYHWPKSDYDYLRSRMTEREIWLEEFPLRTRTVGITRWDSFRFWEAIAFGCLPIQLDFEIYGFDLPIVPEKWLHYIPVDLANIAQSLSQLADFYSSPDLFNYCSTSAMAWAKTVAHPSCLFAYIVDKVNGIYKNLHKECHIAVA